MQTMKAAVLKNIGTLEIEEVPIPVLGENDALVKVSACGICGSDLPRILTKGTYHFPTIPGHEFGGRVQKVGSEKYNELVGLKVAVNPLIPCHHCDMCEIGKFAQCEQYDFLGSRSDGGFAEYVRVPVANLILLPEIFDERATAFLEPVTVALHVVQNCNMEFGVKAAIFGLGAIGMFVAQWVKAFGAKRVFALDIDEHKVQLAKQLGLKDAFCIKNVNIDEIIPKVDFVFEASGAASAFYQGISLLRQSGTLGLVGRPTRAVTIEPNIFEKLLRSQLKIQGTWSFEAKNFPYNAWQQSAEAIADGKIKVLPLISHTFGLENVLEAVQLMAEKKEFYSKVLILPDGTK
ncbi:galactitol-1-phosphate 5-dehydrogenase [Pectinatus frisingensis]|uniref:galactitol-1-phosphate 5-dehydrogenase n=1 Tax=Pectinatus frisingensis TaxID=865 RepID=UPI0018C58A5F|nr:galactitol-1-phosphate 5-dehydrogenase [Pectinatus frisingensis]